jgi:hypothetical protein
VWKKIYLKKREKSIYSSSFALSLCFFRLVGLTMAHLFEEFKVNIAKLYKSISEGDILTAKIIETYGNFVDNPPLVDLEMILSKNLTKDEVIQLLFAPLDNQVQYYPSLITIIASVVDNMTSSDTNGTLI